jgi:glycosyltransferase involved in cell wall biosynthesis
MMSFRFRPADRQGACSSVHQSDEEFTTASTITAHRERRAGFVERKPIRVLHLVSSGGLYGAEQVILNLARIQDAISYVGALCNEHGATLDILDEAQKRGLRTAAFDARGRLNRRSIVQVNRFLRNNRIDIVHTHGYKSDIIGFLACLSGNTRWVATNHVWHPISRTMRLYVRVDAFALRFASRVVAVSGEIREDLIAANVRPANIRVISNGIDIHRFTKSKSAATLKAALGLQEHDVVVAMVGRLSPEKGHKTFLEAARQVSSHKNNVRFLIVGDGPMAEELRAETDRLNVQDRVVFTGFRKDMPEIYALTDVIVNASTIEGLPMTLLEAMASGVAVIAARTGGIPDIIEDDETGLIVDPGVADELRVKIESLVDDVDKRQRLAAAAFEFVKMNHSFDGMCDRYRHVYREVMGEK